jgi:hypothetical protein
MVYGIYLDEYTWLAPAATRRSEEHIYSAASCPLTGWRLRPTGGSVLSWNGRERRCPSPDLRIVVIALTHDLTVVTGNVMHFARVPGLQVETWLVAALVGAGPAAVGGYDALRLRRRH